MIYALEGTVSEKGDGFFVLGVSGVFFKVGTDAVTLDSVASTGRVRKVYCVALFRDGEPIDLFGFFDRDRLDLFSLLRGVSGVGSRTALHVLGMGDTVKVRGVIAEGAVDAFTGVSGVGAKTAERIVLDLKGKIAAVGSEKVVEQVRVDRDVEQALVGLGYERREVREVLGALGKTPKTFEDRVKKALKEISR